MQSAGFEAKQPEKNTGATNSLEKSCAQLLSGRILICGCASLLVLAATVFVLSLDHLGSPPKEMGVHDYLVDWAQAGNNVNLLSQREAHATALLLTALFILLGTKFSNRIARIKVPQLWLTISSLLVSSFCLAGAVWWLGGPVSKFGWAVIALSVSACSLGRRHLRKTPVMDKIILVLIGMSGFLCVGPGLLVPYDASWMPPGLFIEFQQGYSVVSSQFDRVAMGQQIFREVKPNYGFLFPVVFGLWEKHNLMFSCGENIQIIRCLQALTVALFYGAYCWYGRKRPLPILLAVLLILPWFHTNQISMVFPNLSSWRNIGFPLSAVVLILSLRLGERARAFTLGFLSVVCLSINLETGIAISIGLVSFLYFADFQPGKALSLRFLHRLASFLSGIVLSSVLLYLCLTLFLGYYPDISAYFRHLQAVNKMVRTGYSGGFRIEYSPIAVWFLCHYVYILFRTSLSLRRLTQRECFRTFVVTTGLVWSAYYFNRPHEWYFQLQFFFYGFLLIDTVKVLQCWRWRSPAFENRVVAFLVITCLIAPQAMIAWQTGWPYYENILRQLLKGKTVQRNAVMISDIYVTSEAHHELTEKVQFLLAESKRKKVLYLTGSTVLIPKLSKLYLKTDFDDPFMELVSPERTIRFIDALKQSSIQVILIDSDKSYLSGDKYRQACWRYFEEHLAPEFRLSSTEKGWKILKRVRPVTGKGVNAVELQESK